MTTDQTDPYRIIPRGREVKVEVTPTCELVVAEMGSEFYFVARETRGTSNPSKWLTQLEYVVWADLNRNGRLDPDEPSGMGGRDGAATAFFFERVPNALEGVDKPHLISAAYTSHGQRHYVGPVRLP
jgi:hypothetical protein